MENIPHNNACDCSACEVQRMNAEYESSWNTRAWDQACKIAADIVYIVIITFIICAFCWWFIGKAGAQEIPGYSDIQIVNAIYLAEGGVHAQYPFGIRSTSCAGYTSCRQICLTTIKHNRRRFAEYGFKTNPDFISFLGNRYCPIRGRLSKSEKRVNKNWQRNVRYFLRKDRQ